jgi:hypothetical protein
MGRGHLQQEVINYEKNINMNVRKTGFEDMKWTDGTVLLSLYSGVLL